MKYIQKLMQRRRLLHQLGMQLFAEVNMHWYGNASSTCRRMDRVKGKAVAPTVFYVDESIRDGFRGLSFRRYSMSSRLEYLRWKYGI